MIRRWMVACAVFAILGFGASVLAASVQAEQAKQEIKKAGKHIKKAGKETGEAVEETGEAAKSTAKAAKHKVTRSTVEAVCKDGTTYTGKTRSGACARHGGMQAWTKR